MVLTFQNWPRKTSKRPNPNISTEIHLFFQTNAMAVTSSVFPNLNTFRQGPEFCILFQKLESTCQTHKWATLTERYPELCKSLESNPKKICLCFVLWKLRKFCQSLRLHFEVILAVFHPYFMTRLHGLDFPKLTAVTSKGLTLIFPLKFAFSFRQMPWQWQLQFFPIWTRSVRVPNSASFSGN